MDDVQTAGSWLKAERDRLGWSTTETARYASAEAEAAGFPLVVKQQSISQLENGKFKSVPRWFRFVRAAIERPFGTAALPPVDDLSHLAPDEVGLLAAYRKLEPHDQIALIRIARTLLMAAAHEARAAA